jgi:hypothetical protein
MSTNSDKEPLPTMLDDSPRINDLDDLRTYVHETICEKNELEVNVFTMTERILIRGGRPCGLYFCLDGRNSVLFYSPTGERIERAKLTQAPSLVPQAA